MSARAPGAPSAAVGTGTTGAAVGTGATGAAGADDVDDVGPGAPPAHLPPEGRAALRAGVVGNWIDNIHVFLPRVALSPALEKVAGPTAGASAGALVVIAMLLGRPVGGVVLGRVADRLGRTRTTRLAIAGTAGCSLAIACVPTHEALGAATLVLILLLRLAGGVLVAGEYSAAIPLAMEWSAPRRRGLMSGLILSMAPLAQASIAFGTMGLLILLGPERYAAWGWRVLFALGALLSAGMLLYYSRQVVDAPCFHRRRSAEAGGRRLRSLLAGSWRRSFWQAFTMMSGLWLLTSATVLILTARLASDAGLPTRTVGLVMGVASLAQAAAMAGAGHLSTLVGRRRLLIAWGLVAAAVAPWVWRAVLGAPGAGRAALLAALLQVITVSAYGPVAAYLSERFPVQVRSTGYGSAYSLSLVAPALYPFYLPLLEHLAGRTGAVLVLVVCGGLLVVVGAALGPALGPGAVSRELDDVAGGGR